jgi:hypothetical protein
VNLYFYADNDPVNGRDPFGTEVTKDQISYLQGLKLKARQALHDFKYDEFRDIKSQALRYAAELYGKSESEGETVWVDNEAMFFRSTDVNFDDVAYNYLYVEELGRGPKLQEGEILAEQRMQLAKKLEMFQYAEGISEGYGKFLTEIGQDAAFELAGLLFVKYLANAADAAHDSKTLEGSLSNTGPRGTKPADPALLQKLKREGYEVFDDPETVRRLDAHGANASTFGAKDLHLRPDARHIEVVEEYLHNVQRQKGMFDRMTRQELEVHVNEFMLRHQKLLGIGSEDAALIRKTLERYK